MVISYFQNHAVTITYDDELLLGTAVWNGFLSNEGFREATQACMQLIEEKKLLRWLGDNRKLRAIRQADQDWFVENIVPRMVASTLRLHATLVSEDLFNKMAVEQIVKRAGNLGDMVVKEFEDYAQAIAWLKEPIRITEEQV